MTESSRGWRTGSLLLEWGFLVTTGRAAGRWGRQCLSGSGSDTGSDSGSGAWDRPGAHWLGGSIWGSARPHKGARPLAHPSIPAPPCSRRRPPCPGSWPPAASAPSRGAQVRPGTGVRGNAREPAERVGSSRGERRRGWAPRHPNTPASRPAGFPQPFSRYRDGVELPQNQVRLSLSSDSDAGWRGRVETGKMENETRLWQGKR